jgi:hypothetical protein
VEACAKCQLAGADVVYTLLPPDAFMKRIDLSLCGNLWQTFGDEEAGWTLVRCLESSDPEVRMSAEDYLAEAGPRSIKLLQVAVASGTLGMVAAEEFLDGWLRLMVHDQSGSDCTFSHFPYDC